MTLGLAATYTLSLAPPLRGSTAAEGERTFTRGERGRSPQKPPSRKSRQP
jgi:hypothetical protein